MPLPPRLSAAVESLFALALAAAADPAADLAARVHSAALAQQLVRRVEATERTRADLVAAVRRCTGVPAVAAALAKAAAALDLRDRRMAASLLRTAADAHADGRHASVAAVLTALLDMDGFLPSDVPTEWLLAAATEPGGPDHRLAGLVAAWVRRFGAGHPGLRDALRLRPRELLEGQPLHVVVDAHAIEPTPEGWLLLAEAARGRGDDGLELPEFGEALPLAVASLRLALMRAEGRRERAWLKCRLTELGG
jgi:hypothetical protein